MYLTPLDKINLASCAAKRAIQHVLDTDRFNGEYNTATTWRGHATNFMVHQDGTFYNTTVPI